MSQQPIVIDTVQFRRGTAEQWAASTRILKSGEPGLLVQAGAWGIKIGDGSTPWAGLPLIGTVSTGGGSGGDVTLTIGTVTTLSPGQSATASIVNGKLNLGIPAGAAGSQGAQGAQGIQGVPGADGAAGATGPAGAAGTTPNVSAAVTGLAAGAAPTVTQSGTTAAPVFTFGIPAGATGSTGAQGPSGDVAATAAISPGSTSTALVATGPRTTRVTLTAATTFTIAAGTSGQSYTHTLVLVQDGTGSRTVTWPSAVKWNKGVKPTLSTAANAIDLVHLLWTGTEWVGLAGGYALA